MRGADLATEETASREDRQTGRQTDTKTAEGGRGEIGWKDSREQSEINLDTPDGFNFV